MGLTPQQQQAVEYNGTDLLVSAAAGSGKTRVLVERLIGALDNGANIDDFLIITYTRAAALELRGRIQRAILDRLKKDRSDKRLYAQLMRLHRSNIGTIHSFCAGLLREYAAEAGLKPNFRQIEGAEENALKQKALETALEELYAACPPGFDIFADSLSDVGGDRRSGEVILELYNKLQAFPSPEMWMEEQLANPRDVSGYLKMDAERALWFAKKLMLEARRDLKKLPELNAVYGSAFDEDLINVAALKNGLKITKSKLRPARGMTDIAEPFKDARDRFYKLLNVYSEAMAGNTVQTETEEQYINDLTLGIFTAVRAFTKAYKDLKFRKGVLDFSDLEHITHALLCGQMPDMGVPSPYPRLDGAKFAEILVDEYQDINQVQEEIIQALNSQIFMVGDVRQSIYGFRQAEPSIFLKKYSAWSEESPHGARVILPHNFRSHPSILGAVNDIFEKIMLGMEYGEEEKLRAGALPGNAGGVPPIPPDTPASPRAVLVYCDKAGIDDEEVPLRRVQLEAEMVAEICRELVDDGKEPGGIAVLFRAKSGMGFFKSAIEARGLPVTGQEDNILETPELRVAQTYLRILDNPRDDVALLAVMRSPLYNFSPDELVKVRNCADGDFYDALTAASAAGDSKCTMLLRDLIYLRDLGMDMGMDMLYHGMLMRLGLLELFGSMRGGAVRRSNLLSLIPVAARTLSVGELCQVLERMRESGEMPNAAGQNGITLMTIHKSKGLEFNTVILADTSRVFNRADSRAPVLFHREMGLGLKIADTSRRIQYPTVKRAAVAGRLNEDMMQEEMRVLYVALTRAKEHLYVTMTTPDMAKQIERLNMGLDDRPDEYQLLSAKSVSDWLLLALIRDGALGDTETWSVREWTIDNGQLTIKHEKNSDSDLTTIDNSKPIVNYQLSIVNCSLPSKLTTTEIVATGSKLSTVNCQLSIVKPRFMEKHTALTAAERGTALHTALQFVDLQVCLTLDGAKAELLRLERERRLTPEQAGCVEPERIIRFIQSELGARVLASADIRRELPFSLLTPIRELLPEIDSDEKTLFQGVIDLMFFEEGGWVVVDFKSGKPKQEYRRQLKLYENAVRRMTGQRVIEGIVYYL